MEPDSVEGVEMRPLMTSSLGQDEDDDISDESSSLHRRHSLENQRKSKTILQKTTSFLLEPFTLSSAPMPVATSNFSFSSTPPPPISLRDAITSSPWQKWKKYHHIPSVFFLHFLLFVLVTTQVLLIYVETSAYSRSTDSTFNTFFVDSTEPDISEANIYNMDEFIESINRTVHNYYNINNVSLDQYLYRKNSQSEITDPPPIKMTYIQYTRSYLAKDNNDYYFDVEATNIQTQAHTYNLTLKHPLGPFGKVAKIGNSTENKNNNDRNSNNTLQNQFHLMASVELAFSLINLDIGYLGAVPFLWNIHLLYTKNSGEVTLKLIAEPELFFDRNVKNLKIFENLKFFYFINFIILIIALLSFVACIYSIIQSYRLYAKTKTQYNQLQLNENYLKWCEIPILTKLNFFSYWDIFMLFISFMLFSITGVTLLTTESGLFRMNTFGSLLYGLGGFGVSINLLQYLQYYEKFYGLILTLKKCASRVFFFILSCLPVFFAYTLLGVVLFAPYSDQFMNLSMCMTTLFALLQGDSILDIFQELGKNYPVSIIPTLYLTTFIVLFITAVLNIFIFIIEDAYHSAKMGVGIESNRHDRRAKRERKLQKYGVKEFGIDDLFDVLEEKRAEADKDIQQTKDVERGGLRERRKRVDVKGKEKSSGSSDDDKLFEKLSEEDVEKLYIKLKAGLESAIQEKTLAYSQQLQQEMQHILAKTFKNSKNM